MNANEKLTSQGTFENRKKLQLVFMIQTFLLPRPKESFKETNFTECQNNTMGQNSKALLYFRESLISLIVIKNS